MSTLEDVKDLFGQLTTTSLTNLLQSIDIAGGTDSLSGLIVDGADYQTVYGHPFDPLLLLMAAYDPNIPSDATDSVWVKAEKEWSFKADRRASFVQPSALGSKFLRNSFRFIGSEIYRRSERVPAKFEVPTKNTGVFLFKLKLIKFNFLDSVDSESCEG
jgi:hypothetical protein